MIFQDFPTGRFYNEDCFDAMKDIPDGVIDMVLCDLPYGTTACVWDSTLPLDRLWTEYWRVTKPNAAIVLTSTQPFTSTLIMSQINKFKYEWVWRKNVQLGIALANIQPMREHENICVFYREQSIYNKQETKSKSERKKGGANGSHKGKAAETSGMKPIDDAKILKEFVNPRSVLEFDVVPRATGTLHPTQKPVALFEYLIKTYTNENEIVLDNTAGSGTTAIAAINTNRKWVCIEKDKDYYDKAIERINAHTKP